MALPTMTPEQRERAQAASLVARKRRAEIKSGLKRGTTTLAEVLGYAKADEVIAKTKVVALLESLPGVGKVRAKKLLETAGVAENRRVKGLSDRQRAALLEQAA